VKKHKHYNIKLAASGFHHTLNNNFIMFKFLVLIILLCSCSKKNNSDLPVIDIENNLDSFKEVYLSEITDSITLYPFGN